MKLSRVPTVEVESSGTIDDADSAIPQAVLLGNGDVLCSFSNAGGHTATGGTDWARSTDQGRSWTHEGTILPAGKAPPTSNFLKLSRAQDGQVVYAYGARLSRPSSPSVIRFGERTAEPVLCLSEDNGISWSAPKVVPIPGARLEISHAILALPGGRLLAPAATIEPGRLGELVVVAISPDGGTTWPDRVEVFRDPSGERGFLEHKLTDLGNGHLLATAWTIRMADVTDLANSYAISDDSGATWSAAKSTDISGQTLSAISLDRDWLLALYNRRHADPGIVMAVVSLRSGVWVTHRESLLHDPGSVPRPSAQGGVDRFQAFGFGFPTAIRLPDGAILATFWVRETDRTSVRWARLQVAS